jgi:hypothetical protein
LPLATERAVVVQYSTMENATHILNSLDAAEIRKRIENLEAEQEALGVLLRAAKVRDKKLALSNTKTADGQRGQR